MNNWTTQDEINLKEILNFLIRNKINIFLSAFLAFFIGILFAFSQKKIWQGEFQIVLQQDKNPSLSNLQQLSSLFGSPSKGKTLETEIGILESPSILMSIYEDVKENKLSQNRKNKNFMRFEAWKDSNLKVRLTPKTSILSVTYRDTDKNIILPVLKKISYSYQEYSGRKRLRNIELGIEFYESQIDIFQKKSKKSFKEFQEFAIKQDLLEINNQSRSIAANEINNQSRSIAANEIRLIEEKLKSLDNIGENSQELIYLAAEIPDLFNLSKEINNIEKKLFFAEKFYKNSTPFVKEMLMEKEYLYNKLFQQVKGVLLAKKFTANSKLNAAKRPEDTLIKYKQLLNDSKKDEKTLNELENGYRSLLLEKARNEDPWQLITAPTLLPDAVAPNKIKILFIITFIGTIIGSLISSLLEKKNNYIFSINELKSMWTYPIIGEFLFDENETLEESIQFLISNRLADLDKDIEIISVGNLDESLLLKIKYYFDTYCDNKIIKRSSKLKEFSINTKYLFISKLGLTKREDIENLNRKIKDLNISLGLIILG